MDKYENCKSNEEVILKMFGEDTLLSRVKFIAGGLALLYYLEEGDIPREGVHRAISILIDAIKKYGGEEDVDDALKSIWEAVHERKGHASSN